MHAGKSDAQVVQYLTFQIANECYAIPLLAVREIIRYETATKVPQTPDWIHGVINLRGLVLAVVDLALKFGLPATVPTTSTCIVIVEVTGDQEQIALGVLADAVRQVVELRDDDIQPPPSFGTRVNTGFLQGVAKTEGGLALMLDIEQVLLSEERLAVGVLRDQAPEAAQPA